MTAMWHVVCGDAAVNGVAAVLADQPEHRIQVLHDDLAVGPLNDVDTPPCRQRAAFWQAAWLIDIPPPTDLSSRLSADAQWLAALPRSGTAVTVWHGDSCSEQLMLARIAHALSGSDVPLWQVACGNHGEMPRRTVSLCSLDMLKALYEQRSRIDAPQREALALQWRQQVANDAEIRLWLDQRFHPERFASLDQALLKHCTSEWQPLGQALAQVMREVRGFFPTDLLLYWRLRLLIQRGLLQASEAEYDSIWQQAIRLPS